MITTTHQTCRCRARPSHKFTKGRAQGRPKPKAEGSDGWDVCNGKVASFSPSLSLSAVKISACNMQSGAARHSHATRCWERLLSPVALGWALHKSTSRLVEPPQEEEPAGGGGGSDRPYGLYEAEADERGHNHDHRQPCAEPGRGPAYLGCGASSHGGGNFAVRYFHLRPSMKSGWMATASGKWWRCRRGEPPPMMHTPTASHMPHAGSGPASPPRRQTRACRHRGGS